MNEEELFRKIAALERRIDGLVRPEIRPPVGVAVYSSVNISIPNATWTALTFNSERRDDAGFHSVLANTSRLTVPTGYAGWYSIWGNIYWAAMPPVSYLCITYNGGPFISAEIVGNTSCQAVSTSCLYYLNDSDRVELYVWQNSGGALNISASPNYSPEFRMVRV